MRNTSYWLDTVRFGDFPELRGERRCDVAVIGAGLSGITTALLLSRSGADVAVIEADTPGSGTSGHTTAKVTAQHGVKLKDLAGQKAQSYMQANRAGLELIAGLVSEYGVDCDFIRLPSYVYARSEAGQKDIEREMKVYEKLGIGAGIVRETALPFAVKGALVMEDQAQFHPMKYLHALTEILKQRGVNIYAHSRALGIERDGTCTVRTPRGRLAADAVVLATNYPLIDFPGLFFLRLHQERSFIISADADTVDVAGMYINAEQPVNSVRMHYAGGATQLMLGGYGHKTAKENDEKSGYDSLGDFLRADFKNANAYPAYRWSAQDCVTLDGMPYVGPVYKSRADVYVATGYAKWGMTNSAAAAMMIADEIAGSSMIDREIRKAFAPRRFEPAASAKNFVVQAADTIKSFTAGNIGIPGEADTAGVAPGRGAVLRIGGEACAVYRDSANQVHVYSAHCTHMRCPLEYNEAENSFDCPCHGSRFSVDGQVLSGPAKEPLAPIKEDGV